MWENFNDSLYYWTDTVSIWDTNGQLVIVVAVFAGEIHFLSLICKVLDKRIWIWSKHLYNGVIKWKTNPRYWPFVRGIHRSPVNSPHKASDAELWCFLCSPLNKHSSKQSLDWWFETLSRPLWRPHNGEIWVECRAFHFIMWHCLLMVTIQLCGKNVIVFINPRQYFKRHV